MYFIPVWPSDGHAGWLLWLLLLLLWRRLIFRWSFLWALNSSFSVTGRSVWVESGPAVWPHDQTQPAVWRRRQAGRGRCSIPLLTGRSQSPPPSGLHPRTETLEDSATLSLSAQARNARNGDRLLFNFMSFLTCVDVFRMAEGENRAALPL